MQTFIDRYIEQGRQEGEAALLLCLIEDKFGPPSEAMRQRIAAADTDTLLRWSNWHPLGNGGAHRVERNARKRELALETPTGLVAGVSLMA